MPPFSPYKPISPLISTQGWGMYDPKDYAQFGYDRHNGNDYKLGSDSLARAPFAGTIIRTGNQPTGGGIFCGLLSAVQYDFSTFTSKTPDGVTVTFPTATCYVLMDFLHMKSLKVVEGQTVKVGDVLGVQDNTGFSTGPHTHIQSRREILLPAPKDTPASYRYLGNNILMDVDKNDANNTFDIAPFWNSLYAKDVPTVADIITVASHGVAVTQKLPPAQEAQSLGFFAQLLSSLLKWIQK